MIMVSHKLYLKTETGEITFAIHIHKPEPRERDWACRYEIDWPDGPRRFESSGIDALQALVLALQMIGAELHASAWHREGRLRAYAQEKGYGFPVATPLRDLLTGADRVSL